MNAFGTVLANPIYQIVDSESSAGSPQKRKRGDAMRHEVWSLKMESMVQSRTIQKEESDAWSVYDGVRDGDAPDRRCINDSVDLVRSW